MKKKVWTVFMCASLFALTATVVTAKGGIEDGGQHHDRGGITDDLRVAKDGADDGVGDDDGAGDDRGGHHGDDVIY